MKIEYAGYRLEGKNSQQTRSGALLKVAFPDVGIGYADCHPWIERGDQPLDEQLRLLSQGKTTRLTARSLSLARDDAMARKEKRSLFNGLVVPDSHYLLSDISSSIPEGVSLCKLKVGRRFEDDLEKLPVFFQNLPKKVRVRLDFNAQIDRKKWAEYHELLKPYTNQIDFIEDPFPFDASLWSEQSELSGIRFAQDFEGVGESYHGIRVIKPAIEDPQVVASHHQGPIVVTSYLDHPIGQLSAAYESARVAERFPGRLLLCGLAGHNVYQTNKYSAVLGSFAGKLQVPQGTGWGFDAFLDQEEWRPLDRKSWVVFMPPLQDSVVIPI